MAKEIERKFLVTDDSYLKLATTSSHIIQGYITRRKEGTVRIRIRDDRAFLTIKGVTTGISRDEWEYEIPVCDAKAMLRATCEGTIIEKTRYIVPVEGFTWEVDCFESPKQFTIAEVELTDPTTNPPRPSFIGEEVSGNPAYYNSNL